LGPSRDGFAGIAGKTRHTEPDARLSGRCRHGRLTLRVEQAAEPDRCQQKWHRVLAAQHGHAQIRLGDVDGVARPEQNGVPTPAVGAQRHLVIRTAIDVVEYWTRHPFTGQVTQIGNIDGAGERGARREKVGH
jgi:hypothetical protein